MESQSLKSKGRNGFIVMNNDRETIFQSIGQALNPGAERTPLPEYEEASCVALPRLSKGSNWENFAHNFSAVNGQPFDSVDPLVAFLKDKEATFGYCDPALRETVGQLLESHGMTISETFERDRVDDYHFGITRATAAIAETGTVMLTDTDTSDRLAALAPWIHIAVLESPDRLVRTLGDAIRLFGNEPNIVWATGPSKTADIEGILIEGVHGPGEQVLFFPG